jgi:hypothetical protein
VPGSAMPKAPMMDLMDLDLDANNAMRKADQLVRNFKELTTFKKGNDQDEEAIRNALNCGLIGLDDPKAVGSLVTGGQSANLILQIAEVYKTMFSFMGGGMEILGGLAPQSKTAHQDEMLNQNAAAGIQDMQEKTIRFISECGEAMAWFYHHDPKSIQSVTQQVGEQFLNRKIYPWNHPDSTKLRRDMAFEDMDVRVDPYSLHHQTPQQKMAAMNQMLMQVITPLMPMLQPQGLMPDMSKYLELAASWSDLPEVKDLMQMTQPPQAEESGATEMPHDKTLPVATERTTIRRSESGDTKGSGDALRARLMGLDMGGNPNTSGSNGKVMSGAT